MAFRNVAIASLLVNRANDRHGELENETAAIAELFRIREPHMRRLAEDILSEGTVYDPPLVSPDGEHFIVFDGNRRITCLKLIIDPTRAPSQDLQQFFHRIRQAWRGDLPTEIECQVEEDRDRVDAILFRRHTGSQGGVGQSDWDDRAKRNFVERTGRSTFSVADHVEAILAEAGRLPERTIPRSTLNRLLSSEPNRARVGIRVQRNTLHILNERNAVITALARIADDLASRRVVLGDLWDNRGKMAYLNRLEAEGILPQEREGHTSVEPTIPRAPAAHRPGRPAVRTGQNTFIPSDAPNIPWRDDQSRIRAIWEELQNLRIDQYPNAISALSRILLELTMENYLSNRSISRVDDLSRQVNAVANDLLRRGIIEQAYFDEIDRLRRHDELISIRSMQRFIHSPNFAPLARELLVYWNRLGVLICAALTH